VLQSGPEGKLGEKRERCFFLQGIWNESDGEGYRRKSKEGRARGRLADEQIIYCTKRRDTSLGGKGAGKGFCRKSANVEFCQGFNRTKWGRESMGPKGSGDFGLQVQNDKKSRRKVEEGSTLEKAGPTKHSSEKERRGGKILGNLNIGSSSIR